MVHAVQCTCGTLKGKLDHPASFNRGICYCHDCQAFAHYLKRSVDILDRRGGTDILQTLPKHLVFTQGADQLACMRLSEKGLMRWYARCCNTPIGNTIDNCKFSFVGIVHSCLVQGGVNLDSAFRPVEAYIQTQGARGEPKPRSRGMGHTIWRISLMMLRARIDGSYRQTPFFDATTGRPVVDPVVLTAQQRQQLADEVLAAHT